MLMKKLLPVIILILSFLTSFYFLNTNKEKPIKFSGALEALQYWNTQRAYPDESIPHEKFYNEYLKARNELKKFKVNTNDQWEEIGPHNIGGRTLALAFNPQNPNTVYAGSASGGLWVTYSGGEGADAWDLVPTGYPVLGVSTIAVSPVDSNVIYIGSGEVYNKENTLGGTSVRETRGSYGIGILKTTDGGVSWTKSLDWTRNQKRGVWAVRINPHNPNTVWAGTTEGTFKSIDAGETWVKVDETVMVTDLVINPSDTNMVWIACGNLDTPGKGIYRTDDGGENWTQLPIGVPTNWEGKILLSHYQNYPSIIYASVGYGYWSDAGTRLIKSTDYGDSWEIINTFDYSTYQGWFAHYAAVFPDDSSKLLCGGVDLFKSTDGGNNLVQKTYWYLWYFGQTEPGEPEGPSDYVHADQHNYAFHPDDPNIVYFASDGGVFRTTDGGETFEGLNGGYQTTQFYNGFTSSLNDSLLALGGMQDNATAIWHGTLGWYRAIGGDGGCTAIDAENDNILYGSSQYLAMRKSNNGGENWNYIAPNSEGAGFIAPFVSSQVNPAVLYAGSNKIYKTTNRGSNWTNQSGSFFNDDPVLTIAIAPSDDNIVFATTAPVDNHAGLYISPDGGENWADRSLSTPDRYPMDVAISPDDPFTAYLVLSGFGTPHVYKTTDMGDSWADITGTLPDVPTSAVAIDPNYADIIYVGNDLGIYISTDAGESWQTFNEGLLDPVIVMDLSITPVNRTIRAVTHGSGVFNRKLYEPATGIDEENNLITEFKLEQNYPNPFNPTTRIKFAIPEIGSRSSLERGVSTRLTIYDILGNEVITLVNEIKEPGIYEVEWNASGFTSGVYFYRLTAGNPSAGSGKGFVDTKKLILMK